MLITDATAATGMPDGRYRLGSLEVEVKDGKVHERGNLAGSVLTMDLAVRNVMKFAQWDLQQAVRSGDPEPGASCHETAAIKAQHHGAESRLLLKPGFRLISWSSVRQGEVKEKYIRGAWNLNGRKIFRRSECLTRVDFPTTC